MDKKKMVYCLENFAAHHAKGDLPYSALTLEALEGAIDLIKKEIQKEESIEEDGILGVYNGSYISDEDLDLIEEAIRFFVAASGYYVSYDDEIDLQIRAKNTLRKFGLIL